jgi:class 3 adenylate cyclase
MSTGEASCAACGARLPSATAKFCPECGTPIDAPERPREKRKTVTLLFADVTGSTALGEQLDPEAYRSVMGRYFAVSREAVERHGGTVEKFVGDAVLAVFGVPEVREDDALRAVRAAAEVTTAIAALSEELTRGFGVSLSIRVGVNTGPVVVGTARAGGSFATGDAVNTAARLEQAAGPGEVLLGEGTYALVRDAVTAEEREPVTAKGKAEPVRAYRLTSVDRQAAGRARRSDAALVGRAVEARTLDDLFSRTLTTQRGHLVSVLGAPGIGKTRLVADFLQRVGDRAKVLRGRCVSYGQGITYWPLVQVLREAAGLQGDESSEVARHALSSLLRGSADDEEVVRLLLPLLGADGEPGDADQTAWAASRLLEQIALRAPVVVEVDDLHWAEPTLLDLLQRVTEETRDLPLLMVCQARPELLDTHPSWGHGSVNAVSLGLEPFDSEDTAASLASLLGRGVPAQLVEAVAAWSGGNPLFVEEMTTHLVETGMLVHSPDDGGWLITGELTAANVPATVSALLAARLERLSSRERDLLEAVSVVGLEFTTAQARHLWRGDSTEDDTVDLLGALARRDLLRRDRSGGADGWMFRHALIRETAYDGLPKADRSRLHAALAEHLTVTASEAGSAGREQAAFVAHHLTRAAAYASEVAPQDPDTRTLADSAAAATYVAVERVLELGEVTAAIAMGEEVLGLPLSALWRRRLLMQVMSEASWARPADQHRAALDALEATLDDPDAPATSLERDSARMARLSHMLDAGEDESFLPELEALAQRVCEQAREAGDHHTLTSALRDLSMIHSFRAEWRPILDLNLEISEVGSLSRRRAAVRDRGHAYLLGPFHARTLVEHARTTRTPSMPVLSLLALDLTEQAGLAASGDHDPVRVAELERLLAEHRAETKGHARQMLAALHAWAGDDVAAAEDMRDIADAQLEHGLYSYASTYLPWHALLAFDAGTPAEELRERVELAAQHTAPNDVMSVALVSAAKAVLAHRDGDTSRAHELAEHAVETVDRGDQTWNRADVRRWVAPLMPPDRSRELLSQARDLYAEKGLLLWQQRVEEWLDRG